MQRTQHTLLVFSLLVLDEIDQLNSSSQQVLYSIYEWPSLPSSALILICELVKPNDFYYFIIYLLLLLAIANALDLTDRLLPRLQANIKSMNKI